MTQRNAIFSDVLILCGGKGIRLRSVVSERPKVLAEVGGGPFLDILIEELSRTGFKKIILSVGYLKEQVKDRYAPRGIFFAEEESPLGTGGAIKNAEPLITSDHFLVMNGDSLVLGGIDLTKLYMFHVDKNALATIVLARPRTEKDYGAVLLENNAKIKSFDEKQNRGESHFMNAGVYMMSKEIFSRMPMSPFSLESDFFPTLIDDALYGFPVDGEVIDIGTPERYVRAKEVFKKQD